jgi:hypothetical protein
VPSVLKGHMHIYICGYSAKGLGIIINIDYSFMGGSCELYLTVLDYNKGTCTCTISTRVELKKHLSGHITEEAGCQARE